MVKLDHLVFLQHAYALHLDSLTVFLLQRILEILFQDIANITNFISLGPLLWCFLSLEKTFALCQDISFHTKFEGVSFHPEQNEL